MKTIQETIAEMEKRITDELANKINKVCLFKIGSGDDIQYWTVNFTLPNNRIYSGREDKNFACEIIVNNINDWFSIINGEVNPTTAFMHGKIKIQGDISAALKMQTILSN
jgi:putative sterol carrier protein